MARAVMMLSRDVRRVPMDYEPPKDERGFWHPVFDRFYGPALREWQEEKRRWDAGERPDYCSEENRNLTYEEWASGPPDAAYYYPGEAWPDDAVMGIRMYESVTEGTPISEVYEDTPSGRITMAQELAQSDSGITSNFSVQDWLGVIEGQVFGVDIHTNEIV